MADVVVRHAVVDRRDRSVYDLQVGVLEFSL
jgi:hypothetical protein